MVSKKVWLAGVGAALAGPYFALDGNLPQSFRAGRDRLCGQTTATSPDDANWLTSIEQSANSSNPAGSADVLATPIVDLREALRMDIQPAWIVSRWPRVATVTGELDWAGMRVPLITGYQRHDTVGSLTYYFDAQQRLRRIALDGFAGDDRLLTAVAMQNFRLQPEPTLGAGLFVYRWNREPLSVLTVQYAPIVQADTAEVRRRVSLEINMPEPGWRLSPHMQAMLSPRGLPTY